MTLKTTLIRNALAAGLASLTVAGALPRHAASSREGSDIYVLEAGTKHKGDLYLGKDMITIAGEQDGDLVGMAREVTVPGTITGDVWVAADTVNISGTVDDSVRIGAHTVTVTGTIKGDLIFTAGSVSIAKGARITGNLKFAGGELVLDGAVDGDVSATCGEVTLGGPIGGDAALKADIVTITPQARIAGDLDYVSRNQLDLEGKGIVAGSIQHKARKPKPTVTFKGAFWWLFFTATALLVGLAALAVTRGVMPSIVGTLRTEGLRSAGVGFIATIVAPVALLISCILIITIPFVLIALALFAFLVYLAKTPVAVAIGTRILKALGRAEPSAFEGLAVGIPVLYLLFAIPYLGKLLWFGCIFTGLGAILLGAWAYRQARRSSPPPVGAPPAPASASPAPAS